MIDEFGDIFPEPPCPATDERPAPQSPASGDAQETYGEFFP